MVTDGIHRLEAFKRQLLDPVVVEESIVGAIAALRPSTEESNSRRSKLGADLARVQQELSRLTEAIIAGGTLPPLVAAVKDRERQRTALEAELQALARLSDAPEFDLAQVRSELHGYLAEWQTTLESDATLARQMLRKLLRGRLVFTPDEDEDGRYYDIRGHGTLGQVLTGAFRGTYAKAMVTPAGFDPFGVRELRGIVKVA